MIFFKRHVDLIAHTAIITVHHNYLLFIGTCILFILCEYHPPPAPLSTPTSFPPFVFVSFVFFVWSALAFSIPSQPCNAFYMIAFFFSSLVFFTLVFPCLQLLGNNHKGMLHDVGVHGNLRNLRGQGLRRCGPRKGM